MTDEPEAPATVEATQQLKFPVSRNMKVEELISMYDNIIDQVDQDMVDSSISVQINVPATPHDLDGIVQWGPNNDPVLPDDLTSQDSVTIGKLFSLVSNWTNYVTGELTRAKCMLLVQERHLKVIESALKAYYRDEERVPANRVEEKVCTDLRYVTLDASVLRVKVFVMGADNRYDQLKRSLNLISREQTRRGEELQRQIHEGGGGLPSPAWRRPSS